MAGKIAVKGARQHNLKNIDVEIPREKLVVITGVSGSGKSSLAFDTLYAEGQRRYAESLSAHSRQFLERMERPDVDAIEGLSPAIAIGQAGGTQNPRSTVGTITEIYDYLRLLFARIGKPHCYECGREITAQTIQQIVDRILCLPPQTRIHVLAPIATKRKADLRKEIQEMARAGFTRVKIDGKNCELEQILDRSRLRSLDVIVDRLALREGIEKRLADSLEVASRYGKEVIKIEVLSGDKSEKGDEMIFSQKLACVRCGISYPEITPSLFSFNSPHGACPACGGLGSKLKDGALNGDLQDPIEQPPCKECRGTRLRRESLHIKVGGRDIAEITSMPINKTLEFFTSLALGAGDQAVGEKILRGILDRLHFPIQLGLDYLSLDRPAASLSGGEAQRIRLATQVGSNLAGVLYIFDEPSVGLHQRDNGRLLKVLRRLKDLGNTVLVVEHDRETILEADHVIDLGPGAGALGGEVVAQGTAREIMESDRSLTGHYLSGRMEIPTPPRRRLGSGKALVLKGASHHNLKGISVEFPMGVMSCVTGVSGSGKSSLVTDTLYRAMARRLHRTKAEPGPFEKIIGWKDFSAVVRVNQRPIGPAPSSNPASYTGILLHLRELFAQLPEAKVRGYGASRFSFNVKGGRCEACAGDGIVRVEMHFLPDTFVTCEVCGGRRYNRETLEVRYKGRSIADVLDLSVNQSLEFLGNFPSIRQKLETLRDVGLGYLHLGQSAPTLSGGEAQRVKLARELSKRSRGKSLYILDEPTTGLHFEDIKNLLEVLNRLTDAGHTVIVIEHNLDMIKSADYVVDMGPEAGDQGGQIIAYGTPEEIALVPESYTGRFLKANLASKAA